MKVYLCVNEWVLCVFLWVLSSMCAVEALNSLCTNPFFLIISLACSDRLVFHPAHEPGSQEYTPFRWWSALCGHLQSRGVQVIIAGLKALERKTKVRGSGLLMTRGSGLLMIRGSRLLMTIGTGLLTIMYIQARTGSVVVMRLSSHSPLHPYI